MQFATTFKIKELEEILQWSDIQDIEHCESSSKDILLEFCEEELEIPNKFIKEIKLCKNGITVILSRDRSYVRDDWYVNLSRISA